METNSLVFLNTFYGLLKGIISETNNKNKCIDNINIVSLLYNEQLDKSIILIGEHHTTKDIKPVWKKCERPFEVSRI